MKAFRFAKPAGKMAKYKGGLDGIFAINKPMGMSSAQVIRDCQACFNPSRLFRSMLEQERAERSAQSKWEQKRRSKAKQEVRVKIGHAGTLDPLATGVLVLGVGKATKSLHGLLGDCVKTYEAVVLFGAATDTYDRVGRVLSRRPYEHITREAVEAALEGFRGCYQQMPPLYSALKMNGKPLYEYAREGKPVPREIATREVEVQELKLVEWLEPGEHPHRWPAEEAGVAEKSLAERVWRVEHNQTSGRTDTPRKLTPEQELEEDRALAAHQSFKEEVEERQDRLVFDDNKKQQMLGKRKAHTPEVGGGDGGSHQSKRPSRDRSGRSDEPLMSGALGEMPNFKGRGSDLLPPPPDPNAPPPWDGRGPPACRIRMTVSSGFYVRSLCHELGEKVGSAAMMAELVRTRQGEYSVDDDNFFEYDDLKKGEAVWGPKIERILHNYCTKTSSQRQAGKELSFPSIYMSEQPSGTSHAAPAAPAPAEGAEAAKEGAEAAKEQTAPPVKEEDLKEPAATASPAVEQAKAEA